MSFATWSGVLGGACAVVVVTAASLAACSSSTPSSAQGNDGGVTGTSSGSSSGSISSSGSSSGSGSGSSSGTTGTESYDASIDAPAPTSTIAQARQEYLDAGSAPAITVNAIVTAVQGPAGDQVNWYIEDPAGGPYSGIVVYCDPLAAKGCPCLNTCANHIAAPPLNTLVSISGTISAYHGQLQLEPTAQTVLQENATPPPTYAASASDLAETGNSSYRGVYVKFPTTVTVDDVTPAALYDSECNTDGGKPLCSGCEPPTYAGFEVNGPGASAFFVEETFFPFVNLENSPECLTEPDAGDVTVNQTFPFMAGILDVDPYAGQQALSPVQPSDYGQ
jgi:hypothetical protein